ncbi:MAG TPA: peptidoglycan bridge formation glycyltransferase FemA/FemB family protein [Paludibacter sp.]|nr:peptidoglycan bridge formation glycyltransferase FemA/FemB family protein [Paludibacter sp.]
MKIKHLRNKEIEYARWDKCISMSYNQLSYAYTWYLDVVSPNWEALVSEDYCYIMPLPLKKKYGIPYLVQPVLTQQLGIFSERPIEQYIVDEFIRQIPNFSYELHFNEQNFHSEVPAHPNYILNLNHTYEEIASGFSKNTIRNIIKAQKLGLVIQKGIELEKFLEFYYSVEKNYKPTEKSVVERLIKKGMLEGAMTLFGVYSPDNEMIAALCILHSLHRFTYLLPVSSIKGKSSSAMFLLINKLIEENAGKNIFLDFEGSRLEGVARFYRGFGAINQPYYILKRFRPAFLINNKI